MEWPFDARSTADVVGGMFGGAMRWAIYRLSPMDGIIAIFVGGVIAYYLADIDDKLADALLGPFVSSSQPSRVGLGGFIVGILGMRVVAFVIDQFKQRFPSGGEKDVGNPRSTDAK